MPKTKFTKTQILDAAKKLHLNMELIPYETLKAGLIIELEHGKINDKTNITDNDIIMTMKIVLAHLREGLAYYDLLEKLEKKLDKIRKKVGRPKLYLD